MLQTKKFCYIDHCGANYDDGTPEWPQNEYGSNADDGVVNDGFK